MNHYIALDWGGTFLKYAYMDEESSILEKGKIPSPSREDTKENFLKAIDSIVERFPAVDGIAISSPGIIDSTKGIIQVIGVFPYLTNCAIAEELQKRYGVPVSIENDAKCAALAELWKGSLADVNDGIVFVIGTAIGGGIVLNHQLRRGKDFFAGEFSAMNLNWKEPNEKQSYMAQLGYKRLLSLVQEKTGLSSIQSGEEAFALMQEGNQAALEALEAYTDLLALQLFNLNVLLNVEKICIGGGISRQPLLLESIRRSVEKIRTYHPDILQGIALPLPNVDVCTFYNDANLIGALYHWFERNEKS